MPRFFVHAQPGFGAIVGSEIARRLPGATVGEVRQVRRHNDAVTLDYAGDAADVMTLRTIEDLFWTVAHVPGLPWGYEGQDALYGAMRASAQGHNSVLEGALAVQREMQDALGLRRPPRRRRNRRWAPNTVTFRVIARLSGPRQPYRRTDLAQSVTKAVEHTTRKRWRAVDEGEDVELWANVIGREFLCGLRLSDESLRHRDYKAVHLPASLRPSVAAALAWLTAPRPGDVFLDPLCGAGTVLVERAMIERHRLLVGGELDGASLAAAAENIGPRHKPRHLLHWDARNLPLDTASVDAVATNLPFGVQSGDRRELPKLYGQALAEIERVLKPGRHAVVLTGDASLVKDALRPLPNLAIAHGYTVAVLGREAMVYVLRRG